MRKLWLLGTFFWITCAWGQGTQVSSFPYVMDFENFSLCWADCRFRCQLSDNWSNEQGDPTDWSVGQGTTPTSQTGPQQDFMPGTSWGKYLYLEASSGCAGGASASLISPYFNLLSLPQPILSFAYHMQGIGQGRLHLDVDTAGSWERDVVAPFTAETQGWEVASFCLSWLEGRENVRFRLRAVTGRTEASDIAIDAFQLYAAPVADVYISQILNEACGRDSQEVISFEYGNLGQANLTQLSASYAIGNQPFSRPETLSGSLKPCEKKTFAFSERADLSGGGLQTIRVAISATPQDANPANDTLEIQLNSLPLISHFPYEESFEHGSGHWRPLGNSSSWAWGIPSGNWVRGAPHGLKGWHTQVAQGKYQSNEFSYLESPCFDLSGFTVDPVLVFEHAFELEAGYDSSWLEYSLDGGRHWYKVAQQFTFLENGYNRSQEQVWGGLSAGGAGQWQTTALRLDGLAGETVRFRFSLQSDSNIEYEGVGIDRVRLVLPYDVAITEIETPYDTCGGVWGNAEPVRIRVWNKGYHDIPNLQLSYYLSGTRGYIVPERVPGGLASGDSTVYTFSNTVNLARPGAYSITAAVVLVNDNFPQDNFLQRSTGNYPWASVSLGDDTLFCSGEQLRLIAQAADAQSYTWSDGTIGREATVSKRGWYSVEVVDDNGCPGWDTIRVDVLPQPRVGILSRESVRCYGDSTGMLKLSLFGSVPPYQFQWDDGGDELIRMNLPAGHYPFVLSDQNGCSLRDSIEIRQSDSLAIHLEKISAAGCPADSSGAIEVDVRGGQRPYQYQWSNGEVTQDLSRLQQGIYALKLRDALGCLAQSPEYKVNQADSLPSAGFSFRVSGGTVLFNDSSSNARKYHWDFGDGNGVEDESSPSYTYHENGEYVVKLIASNGCGQDTFSAVIRVDAVPIDAPHLARQVRIGPNPLRNSRLTLRFQEPSFKEVNFELHDMTGRLLLSRSIGRITHTSQHQVQLPLHLSEGVYLATLLTDQGLIRQRIRLLR